MAACLSVLLVLVLTGKFSTETLPHAARTKCEQILLFL